jgi:ketosteroid isomerase-like protein
MPLKLSFKSFIIPEDQFTFAHQNKPMPATKTTINDKAEIKKMIDDFMAALCNKDVKRMMSGYASDVVIYDVKPPFFTKGAVAWKHTWEACIDYFPASFQVEIRDLYIHVGGDVAISHYFFRLKGKEKDHDAMQTWMRTTTGYKRQQGKWKVVHEHGSLPFNPHTGKAMFTLEL